MPATTTCNLTLPRIAAMLAAVIVAFPALGAAAPVDLLAWLHLETRALKTPAAAAPSRAVLDSFWRWTAPGRVMQYGAAEDLLHELLVDAVVLDVPITVSVFDLQEQDAPVVIKPARLSDQIRPVRMSTAIRLRTGDHHEKFVRRVRALLRNDPDSVHREFTLPGGQIAFECRRPDREPWRVITWCELKGELIIGIGEDALQRGLALRTDQPTGGGRIDLHRGRAQVGKGVKPVVELFVDIDRLRRAFPDRFDNDAGARLLTALRLSNARSFMMHVAPDAPGAAALRIEATWSLRSEPRDSIRSLIVTSAQPAIAGADQPHAVLAADYPAWASGVMNAYGALLSGREADQFAKAARNWTLRRLPTLQRLAQSFGRAPTVYLDAASAQGLVMVVPLTPEARPDVVRRDLAAVLSPFADHTSSDAARETWWLRPPPASTGPLRAATWGLARTANGNVLVIGFDFGLEEDGTWLNAVITDWRRQLNK